MSNESMEPKLSYTDEVNDSPTNMIITADREVSEEEIQKFVKDYTENWASAQVKIIPGGLNVKQFLKVPFIGRLVYLKTYENIGDTELVDNYAQVIKVHSPEDPRSKLDLFVILQNGKMAFITEVQYGDLAGDWHWPPYVPDREV